ncbi:bpX6 domain-containing protein [Melittangium boletus]|uniref:MoxR-vWA-beta-propeller ternary system domain-containing protein n=1 Tax=Melittangium boletus DSM 14713 TaxID=1294270 RepID=A0A250IBT1_9BACT|nr:bpX6 domain-containing protein [Melittangium boletus]ATB29299.1 hypothetical protein MEBOL_002748 [Melittangium boletus DSM 14713]
MSPVRPRAQVHRGRVVVAALWFEPALLGEAEARRRVLTAWAPGVEVFSLAGGFLLRWAAPVRMDCAAAPGLVFTQEEGVLWSAPLSPTERERLSPPPGSVVRVRAGTAEVHPPGAFGRVDVSAWLETSGWSVVPVVGLGAPPPPVVAPALVAPPSRANFGVGAPAPEAEALRTRMEGRAPAAPPGLFARLLSWWRARRTAAPPVPPPARQASSSRGPELFSRLTHWLATATPLGAWLGRLKAQYVRRLFELFDEGKLEEALRYAIPLGKGALTEQARVSLGLPGPRESLSIQPRGGQGRAVFGGGQVIYDALRERYREAFRKMEREGRIEEAAFILAELLGEAEEAVSFLERHGRLKLAAELAEGRALAPGLVVRQWMLARDVARAVDVARRTGAFADAVSRLERTHSTDARALRLHWGEVLAQAGDYFLAADAVWPVEESRGLVRVWLEGAVEVGGTEGARALARLLLAFPERFDAMRPRVLELLDADGPREASARQRFASDLVGMKMGGAVRELLLRQALRALLRDRAAGHVSLAKRELERLVQESGDPVLVADLPTLPSQRPSAFAEPVNRVFGEDAGGPWPIHDAVPLAGGRVLVALGELGARLLAPDGRCVAHFDVPAFSLVRSWHGDRALALAPRGELQRVSRLDLVRRRAEPWCDLRADAFAREYDGGLWFVAERNTVMALDALASEPRALWRVREVGSEVVGIAADASLMSAVCVYPRPDGSSSYERWSYALPGGPTLRSRQGLDSTVLGGGSSNHLSLRADGEMTLNSSAGAGVQWVPSVLPMRAYRPALPEAGEPVLEIHLGSSWLGLLEAPPENPGHTLRVLDRGGRVYARLRFEGSHPGAAARLVDDALLFFDARGWLVRVDLPRTEVRRIVPR